MRRGNLYTWDVVQTWSRRGPQKDPLEKRGPPFFEKEFRISKNTLKHEQKRQPDASHLSTYDKVTFLIPGEGLAMGDAWPTTEYRDFISSFDLKAPPPFLSPLWTNSNTGQKNRCIKNNLKLSKTTKIPFFVSSHMTCRCCHILSHLSGQKVTFSEMVFLTKCGWRSKSPDPRFARGLFFPLFRRWCFWRDEIRKIYDFWLFLDCFCRGGPREPLVKRSVWRSRMWGAVLQRPVLGEEGICWGEGTLACALVIWQVCGDLFRGEWWFAGTGRDVD